MSKINIIYLLPEMKGASGGAKVIYNHSLILNTLNKRTESCVVHLKKKLSYKFELSLAKKIKFLNKKIGGWDGRKMKVSNNFLPDNNWYNDKIKIIKNLKFNKNKDFIIIPEIFAHFAEELELKKKRIKYAIFVQGSFHMGSSENFNKIKFSYENANLIISTSSYSLDFIKGLFPKCKKNILKINLSVNTTLNNNLKKNYITCMPRKLPSHFFLLQFYLKNKIPKNWKIDIIDNVSKKELLNKLKRSKIFLSFSHFEGLGLPPLEAALTGNKVIGYIGGGGKEYWKKPIFNVIEYGEISKFGNKILKEIHTYNSNWIKKTEVTRDLLAKKYSKSSERKSLINLSNKIIKFFN